MQAGPKASPCRLHVTYHHYRVNASAVNIVLTKTLPRRADGRPGPALPVIVPLPSGERHDQPAVATTTSATVSPSATVPSAAAA